MHISNPICQLPILLLVSFDGFRHDYINPDLTPNLDALSKRAATGHMQSMYFTKTFPNHFSMVTGLFVDEHQVINNYMYDPKLECSFNPSTSDTKWWNPINQTTPIWTANEIFSNAKCPRYSGSVMFPGSDATYHDRKPTYLLPYQKRSNWTRNIEQVVDWITDPNKPANFVSLYFDQPDTKAHQFGPWHANTLNEVKEIDKSVGYLLDRINTLGLEDRVDILFVSDHGMAEVRNLIFLEDKTDTSRFDFYGASPIWSVFLKPDSEHLYDEIYEQLLAISQEEHFKIYKRDQIPKLFHYSKSSRVGDYMILVDKNYELFKTRADKKFRFPDVWGNHGWTPTDPDMRPLFIALGRRFKQNFQCSKHFEIIDLFPLMVNLLDLPASRLPNNGTFDRVNDLLDIESIQSDMV